MPESIGSLFQKTGSDPTLEKVNFGSINEIFQLLYYNIINK